MLKWALLAVASLLAVAEAQRPPFNTSVPQVLSHTPLQSLILQVTGGLQAFQYGGCASDAIHTAVNLQPGKNFYSFGGVIFGSTNTWGSSIYWSVSPTMGFQYVNIFTPTTNSFSTINPAFTSGSTPVQRVAPSAIVWPNGNFLMMGGKAATSFTLLNDVIQSTNNGQTWTTIQPSAPWQVRSDASIAIQPGTTNMLLIGGEIINFVYLNDVWYSTDGVNWSQLIANGAAPFTATQDAPCTFMYDGPTNANKIPSFIYYDGNAFTTYISTNAGTSFQVAGVFPSTEVAPQQTGKMVADVQGNLYMAGGVFVGSQIYISSNKGASWLLMSPITYVPGLHIFDVVTVSSFQYGCLAINYITSSTVAGGYRKQLIEFSGTIQGTLDTNTWFNCSISQPSTTYSSVTNEIIIPGEPLAVAAEGYVPTGNIIGNAATSATLIFHNAYAQIQSTRFYGDWAYDVHSIAKYSSTIKTWSLGGYSNVNTYPYANTIDFCPTGNWNQFTTYTPTYSNPQNLGGGAYNASAQTGKVAAGVAYLSNGNLVVFGGKDGSIVANYGTIIGVTNDVVMSTNNGQTFVLVTYAAPWAQRSDQACAVMPGTNTILMGGGQANPYYSNIGDFWISTDGQGAIWTATQTTSTNLAPFGVFQDAAMTFFYDNMYVNPTAYAGKTISTVIINTGQIRPFSNQDAVYASTNLGNTWTLQSVAPWSMRLRNNFVADANNNVFMAGGDAELGDVWVSSNMGVTWTLMLQTPQSPGPYNNIFSYEGSVQTGMSLRYIANPNSPNGYHEQLVMFGGALTPGGAVPSDIFVAAQPSSECVYQTNADVVYGEVMYPSERNNPNFADTSLSSNTNTPTLNLNTPWFNMPGRWYPSCVYDVQAVYNGNTPQAWALGGFTPFAYIPMASFDTFTGNNVGSYSTYVPSFSTGFGGSALARVAGGAGVTNIGALVWYGGKLANYAMANDVWYSMNGGQSFDVSVLAAPWPARSDMGYASVPNSPCIIMAMGYNYNIYFNDLWTSCDGYGATWLPTNPVLPWGPNQQPSIVALYDGSQSTPAAPTNTILFYTFMDQMVHSSNNLGASWTTVNSEVPWTSRQTAKFVADTSNYVYLIGGSPVDADQTTTVIVPDAWFSSNKGQTWQFLVQKTNAGYPNPVSLQVADYACVTLASSQNSHRQLVMYSGDIGVFSNNAFITTGSWFNEPTCMCTSQSAVKAVYVDLLFPGENPIIPGSSSSSTTYSAGQTAGIAIGVAVGFALILCLIAFFVCGAGALTGKKAGTEFSSARPQKFENESSQVSQATGETSNVELH